MNTKKHILIIAITAALIMSVAACGDSSEAGSSKVILTAGFDKDEVFRLESLSCTLPEVKVYMTNFANQYEQIYGSEVWSTDLEGTSLIDNIKDDVLSRLARVKAMNLLALQQGITLDTAETEYVSQMAVEYYDSLNDTEKVQLGVDEALILQMYTEYAIANKVYESLIADINPEISDDEARTITVADIYIESSMDNAQSRITAYERAKQIVKLINEGEDFQTLAAMYSDGEETTYSFGKGSQDVVIEEAGFNLGEGEVSDILETDTGYHILKCLSTFNKEETDRNKIKIVEQKRQAVFDQEYNGFVEDIEKNLNEELWNNITFMEDENITTSSFFTIYEKYYGE